jgi:hypothetical protein
MRCYFDLDLGMLVQAPGYARPLTAMMFKRGDAATLEVSFHRRSAALEELGGVAEMIFVVKDGAANGAPALMLADAWTLNAGIYSAALAADFAALSALLGAALFKDLLGELTLTMAGGGPVSSQNIKVRVYNDLWKGTEGTPMSMPSPEEWLDERLPATDAKGTAIAMALALS